MSGRAADESMPDHIRRYTMNQHKIPTTHFSMLNQMIFHLLAPLEIQGYTLPRKLVPDISLGRIFSGQLRDRGFAPETFPTYPHEFPDGRLVHARLYPNSFITDFNDMVDEWLRERAWDYFKKRDHKALQPLQRVLARLPPGPDDEPVARALLRGRTT